MNRQVSQNLSKLTCPPPGADLPFNFFGHVQKMFMRKYLFLVVILSANYFSGFTQSSIQTDTVTLLNHPLKRNLSNNYFQREAREGTPIVLRGTIISPE